MTIALFSEEVKDRSLRSLANYEGQGVDEACEAINSATKGLGVSIVVVRDLSYSSCPRVIRTALVDSKLTLGMAITLPLRLPLLRGSLRSSSRSIDKARGKVSVIGVHHGRNILIMLH